MKAFTRVTAVVFVALGVLIIFGGIIFAVSGLGQQNDAAQAAYSLMPDLSGLVILMRFFGGGIISLQGFFLAAIGQGLWLLVDISNNTEKTSMYLGSLTRRNKQ